MSIKTKVALGVAFLFMVILAIGGIGLYYLRELSQATQNIIRNNYETLEYTQNILKFTGNDYHGSIDSIEVNLLRQEANITERDEHDATVKLRTVFERYRTNPGDSLAAKALQMAALDIHEINMNAIVRKNIVAQETATRASTYVVITLSIFAIVAFTFIVNFPGYIADPIVQLTSSIKSIANKNYEERLHFDRHDEFEELAQAFNQMAEKLDEYEHSNLARAIFEKRRIETIINLMRDPVIGLDEYKKVIFANDEALVLLNIGKDQLVGRYAPDVALENDLLRNLIREGNSRSNESNLIKIVVSGKENYFAKETIVVRYTPTGEKNIALIGQVLLLKNVTPFKELDLAKTNFIATISHELKTPIASLQMCTKLLLDHRVGQLNDEQENLAVTMRDEVTRLSKITHELLDLAQVETGNIKLSIKSVHPAELLRSAKNSVNTQAQRKHIDIAIETPDNISSIQADADKTTWVIVNFLTNAIRHSHEYGKIIIRCNEHDNVVRFSVQDFGSGIDPMYMNRLFEKFFQVPGATNGSGLGLAISREIIESQNGKIFAESEPGKGSIFSFELPRIS